MAHSRRNFLGWLGGTSLLGMAGLPTRASAATVRDGHAHAEPIADTWDMSWTARVSGKYKAVFDSPEMSGSAALYRAVAWCDHYKEVYGAARSDMSPVVVFRHKGFYMAMNDEYWQLVNVGKDLEERDERGKKWAKHSPVGAAAMAAQKPEDQRFGLAGFLAEGGIALACGWSFGGASSRLAKQLNIPMPEARERAKAMLVPGVILQPNGIFAALRAQEAGCSYIDAS